MKRDQDDDAYSEREAQRRFEATLRGAIKTPPKPLSEIAPKQAKPARKNRQRPAKKRD